MPGFRKGLAKAILEFFWPPDPTDGLYNQATTAYAEYQASGKLRDLQTALTNFEATLNARRPVNHPQLAVTLINYAATLWTHYEVSGRPDTDLWRVIELEEEALALWAKVLPRPSGYPILLTNLGNAYFDAYSRDRSKGSFQKAVSSYKAVRDDKSLAPDIHNMALARMGIALWTRCDLDKTRDGLDEGIDNLEAALKFASSANDFPLKSLCLPSLANAYDVRFQQFKQDEDLSSAIEYSYAARQILLQENPERGPSLYNLSRLLWARHQQKGDKEDLNEAEKVAKEAQDVVKDGELQKKVGEILKAVKEKRESEWESVSED
jgi:tetratricopeptide (TPR) repeat protein